jgi:uncharacterized protein involved in exopolysaccharide biosynthesis
MKMNQGDHASHVPRHIISELFGYDLGSFLLVSFKRKRIILSSIILSTIFAIILLNLSTYKYTATLKVAAAQQERQLPSNLAGLASLAGVSLPGGKSSSQLTQYIEMMKSRDVAEAIVSDRIIMHHAFADEWDAAANQWRPKTNLIRSLVGLLKDLIGMPKQRWEAPSAKTLNRYIERNLKLGEDSKNNVLVVMIEDQNPEFAIYFLNKLHSVTDNELRKRALDRSRKYIRYLERKLPEITNADQRKSLIESLGEQEKAQMLASADVPFAAEPLGKATPSWKPTNPKPAIIIPLACILGLLIGLLIAFLAEYKSTHASTAQTV